MISVSCGISRGIRLWRMPLVISARREEIALPELDVRFKNSLGIPERCLNMLLNGLVCNGLYLRYRPAQLVFLTFPGHKVARH